MRTENYFVIGAVAAVLLVAADVASNNDNSGDSVFSSLANDIKIGGAVGTGIVLAALAIFLI